MTKILTGIITILIIFIVVNLLQMESLKEQIKTQNEIIEIDNQLIQKHKRELELYGDYIVAILEGEDRKRILMKEEVLKAGANMIEIKKEIDILKKERIEINKQLK